MKKHMKTQTGNSKSAALFAAVLMITAALTGCNMAEDSPTSLSVDLVSVPAGYFQRDSTSTNISYVSAFYMSKYQVTRELFEEIMGTDPSSGSSYSSGKTDPVSNVNWYHAIAFCNKLSLKDGLNPVYSVSSVDWAALTYSDIPTSSNSTWNSAIMVLDENGYRLPTEMEWMWAAMGADSDSTAVWTDGVNTTGYAKAFAGSNGTNSIGDYAWYSGNSSNTTHPVGKKLANELGVYDMSGNVFEWCWDGYTSYSTGTLPNWTGYNGSSYRCLRGGNFYDNASICTIAKRNYYYPYQGYDYNGFRVVKR